MTTFDLLADLPVEVERYTLEGRRLAVSSGFERLTTVVHLEGDVVRSVVNDVLADAVEPLALEVHNRGQALEATGDVEA